MRELREEELPQVSGGCRDTKCQLPPPLVELYPHLSLGGGRDVILPGPNPFLPYEVSQ